MVILQGSKPRRGWLKDKWSYESSQKERGVTLKILKRGETGRERDPRFVEKMRQARSNETVSRLGGKWNSSTEELVAKQKERGGKEKAGWRFLSNCDVGFARENHFRCFSTSLFSRGALIGWMRVGATSASFRFANRRICRATKLPDRRQPTERPNQRNEPEFNPLCSIVASRSNTRTCLHRTCFRPSNWMTTRLESLSDYLQCF